MFDSHGAVEVELESLGGGGRRDVVDDAVSRLARRRTCGRTRRSPARPRPPGAREVELEWAVDDVDRRSRSRGRPQLDQRGFEPAFADVAPRAHDVGEDLDRDRLPAPGRRRFPGWRIHRLRRYCVASRGDLAVLAGVFGLAELGLEHRDKRADGGRSGRSRYWPSVASTRSTVMLGSSRPPSKNAAAAGFHRASMVARSSVSEANPLTDT